MKRLFRNPAAWMVAGACAVVVGIVLAGMIKLACSPAKASPRANRVSALIPRLQLAPQSVYMYWLSECEIGHWPAIKDALGDEGIRVIAHNVTPRRARALLLRNGYIGSLEAHNLGERTPGFYLWSIRAPRQIRVAFLNATECPTNRYYSQVLDLPAGARDWVKARSVCIGEATLGGRTFAMWPCRWETERGLVVNRLDGVGPGVTNGGSIRAAAGL